LKPFRFGVLPTTRGGILPLEKWTQTAIQIEKLGYSTVFWQDHFSTRAYDPIAMLASAASATKKLNIGSLVFAVDFRHPTILAKAAATLHLLSSGRFEFGIGAGYQPNDYNMTGIPLDPASMRVERLEEALKIITGMWTQERTSFSGKHYQVTEMQQAGELPKGEHPKIMIGGGGRKMLKLAAQYADIVGIIPRWRGSFRKILPQESTSEGIKRKIIRVKNVAKDFGRDPDEIEFQQYIRNTEISDNPEPMIEKLAKSFGSSTDAIYASEAVSIGSSSFIRDRIKKLREETGINYFVLVLRGDQIEEYAESIVQPLTS
jgi:probable F420-dependent oxidoreductase